VGEIGTGPLLVRHEASVELKQLSAFVRGFRGYVHLCRGYGGHAVRALRQKRQEKPQGSQHALAQRYRGLTDMSILHFRSIERRRTARAVMSMRLVVSGERADGQKFKFWTRTESVSRHGGIMILNNMLDEAQQVELLNEFNHKKARVRIVSVKRSRDGQVHGAFEFVQGEENFWSMNFPVAGAKPLRRWTARPAERAVNETP
jgi:hypothetical protein